MMEQLFMELLKSSPILAVMCALLYYFAKRSDAKDLRVNEMHSESIKIVQEMKNEMMHITTDFKKDLIILIKEQQSVIVNNSTAMHEMKNAIQDLSKNIEKISTK